MASVSEKAPILLCCWESSTVGLAVLELWHAAPGTMPAGADLHLAIHEAGTETVHMFGPAQFHAWLFEPQVHRAPGHYGEAPMTTTNPQPLLLHPATATHPTR